jgi:hypothetical protein
LALEYSSDSFPNRCLPNVAHVNEHSFLSGLILFCIFG